MLAFGSLSGVGGRCAKMHVEGVHSLRTHLKNLNPFRQERTSGPRGGGWRDRSRCTRDALVYCESVCDDTTEQLPPEPLKLVAHSVIYSYM